MFSRLKPSNNFRRPARPTRDAKRVAARYLPGPTISKRYTTLRDATGPGH